MSDKIKLKVNVPMFEVGELEAFDNNIHNIVEEYSKMLFKEKDQILTQRIIMKQEEEIERLNNIINELEKWLEERIEYIEKEKKDFEEDMQISNYEERIVDKNEINLREYQILELEDTLEKIQELKGDGSNEKTNS